VSLATRLAGALLALSLASLAIATLVGLNAGFDLGRDIYEQRLETAADAAAFDIAAAIEGSSAANEALALSPEAAVAIDRFAAGVDELRADPTIDTDAITADLVTAYDEPYLSRSGPDGRSLSIGEVISTDPAALFLQRQYSVQEVDAETGDPVTADVISDRPTEVRTIDDASRIDNAGDGSTWSAVHDEYHSAYRRVVEEFGLRDLYLVEPDEGVVVYSVGKGPDLGTSLTSGPMSGSVLSNTVKAVIEDPKTARSDLNTYVAASGELVGVIASPVFDGDELAGVVAITYDADRIDSILDRPPVGDIDMPDVFLAGTDGTLRSNPRGFRDDPAAYLAASEEAGSLTPAQSQAIRDAGSVALIQTVSAATAESAVAGDIGVEQRPSVTGSEVFGTVQRVPVESPVWFVVGELDFDDAEAALADFRSILIVGTSLFVLAIAFFAVGWAQGIVRPVKLISERLGDPDSRGAPLEIPTQSPIEMHHLVESFESMAETLDRQQVSLALAREDRLDLMKQMLPAAIADRVANGELDGVDEVQHATVVVVVVLGLGELVRRGGPSRLGLVDRLHAELDELADHHGLDRIKVVGDAYFASCGHDRPFIDHAPRVVAFATDARDAVRAIGAEQGDRLAVGAGVQTGRVTVGMTGGARLVYDVWGETVTMADQLARRAGPNVVLVSDTVRKLLPDEIEVIPAGDADGVWAVAEVRMASS
jgi:class 3 adenylate cyclase